MIAFLKKIVDKENIFFVSHRSDGIFIKISLFEIS